MAATVTARATAAAFPGFVARYGYDAVVYTARPLPQLATMPRHSVRLTGLVITENEFPAGNGGRYDLFPTRAYATAHDAHTQVLTFYDVKLRHGAADQAAFDSQLRPLGSLGDDDLDTDAAAIQRAITPQAVGWWVLAGLIALAGLAVLGQAAARHPARPPGPARTAAADGRPGPVRGPRGGGGRRAAQRAHRRPVRARTWPGPPLGPGGKRPARHDPGGHCAVRDHRFRGQPDLARPHARLVRGAVRRELRQRGGRLRCRADRRAAAQPAT
jgi:hypothetical protein